MSEVWLWFWRPIAETLGVIVLLALFIGCALLWITVSAYWRRLSGRNK